MFNNPQTKVKLIRYPEEARVVRSLMEITEHNFGFDFHVFEGHVTDVSLIAAGMRVVPRQLKRLPNLRKLTCPSNHIRKLQNIQGCQALQIVNLQDNQLKAQALEPLIHLPRLRTLNLSQNEITDMEILGACESLTSLDVSDNHISNIPATGFSRLQQLDLRSNPINRLQNVHHMAALTDLRLDLKNFPVEAQALINQGPEAIKNYCKHLERQKTH